jgi:hypothetical protein
MVIIPNRATDKTEESTTTAFDLVTATETLDCHFTLGAVLIAEVLHKTQSIAIGFSPFAYQITF